MPVVDQRVPAPGEVSGVERDVCVGFRRIPPQHITDGPHPGAGDASESVGGYSCEDQGGGGYSE